MDFKYKTTFTQKISLARNKDVVSVSNVSKANLDDLHRMFPDQEIMVKDKDLLYIGFNCAVAGLINRNGDGITTETAKKLKGSWAKRPMNIEHDRESVVGFILDDGFSTFGSNQLIDDPDLSKPFNICATAIIWRTVYPWFAEHLEESSLEGSYHYNSVSTSWEISFNRYSVARGSRNLSKAEIITDEKEIERLSKFLSCNGGEGFDENGNEIYRVIEGDCIVTALGLVGSPAANVEGLVAFRDKSQASQEQSPTIEQHQDNTKSDTTLSSQDTKEQESCQNESISSEKEEKNENKISHIDNSLIKPPIVMKFQSIEELYENLSTAGVANVKEIREFIDKELKAKDQELAEKRKADEDAKSGADNQLIKETLASLQEKNEANEKALQEKTAREKELSESIAALQKELEEIKASQTLEVRIEQLNEKYEFTDKMREAVANSIKNKSADEFNAWLEDPLTQAALASFERKEKTEEDKVDETINQLEKTEVSTAGLNNKQEEVKVGGPLDLKYRITNNSKK